MGPLVPIVIGVVAATAIKVSKDKQKPKLTPKRKMILETAMNSKLTPDQLKKLADAFDKEGLKVEADLLRKRIDLQTAPQDQKDKWAAAFKKAMASEKPEAINAVADAFEDKGATGAATTLRQRANDIKTGKVAIAKAPDPPAPPPPMAVTAVSSPPPATLTGSTVGSPADLTSSMNQGQPPPPPPPAGQPAAGPVALAAGGLGGPSGNGESTIAPGATQPVVATPLQVAAASVPPGLPPVLSPASASAGVAGTVPVVSGPVATSPATGPVASSPVKAAPSAANPTATGPTGNGVSSGTVGDASDMTSSMNQK
jgi:hypothetical protein